MHGSATLKKVVAAWVTMCMLLSSFSMMTIADDDEQVNNVTDGHLVFKGFDLKYNAASTGNKIQALVDVYVDNIDATGVGFVLKYNRNYLEPSDYNTNAATEDVTAAFKSDSSLFPDAYPLLMYEEDGIVWSQIVNETQDNGYIELNLNPMPGADGENFGTAYIGPPDDKDVTYVKTNGGEMRWGTISFTVNNPVALTNLSDDDLRKVLYISGDPFADPESDPDDEEPYEAYISYVDNEKIERFFGPKIPVKWQVSSEITQVEPAIDASVVSAYSLYQRAHTGQTDDLITYLNQTMGDVYEIYSTSEKVKKRIIWDTSAVIKDERGTTITDTNYNPKGGVTYTITQNYLQNPNKDVTVKVKVTTSELTGFIYDRRIKTYPAGTVFNWGTLELPPYITPIITGTDDLFIAPTDAPEGYQPSPSPEVTWAPEKWDPRDVSDLNSNTNSGPYTVDYKHEFNTKLLGVEGSSATTSTTLPWLTIVNPFSWNIIAKRTVLPDGVSPPTEGHITAYVERESGDLIIEIAKEAFGADWIPDNGTNFNIYMPNGMVLSTAGNGDFVTAPYFGDDGSAKIRVASASAYNPSGTNTLANYRELIQSIINLGSTGFKISAIPATGKVAGYESDAVSFRFDARTNYYIEEDIETLASGSTRKYDEKDYSGALASLFRVYEEQELSALPTYIVFPDHSTIDVAYNGQTGYQKPFVDTTDPNSALLDKAKVVSWTWEYADGTALAAGDDPAKLPAAGTDIYLVGKLQPYSYTNFGMVYNPENPPEDSAAADEVYLKLKATTLQKSSETPTPTPTVTPTEEPYPPEPTETPTPTTPPEPNKIRISTMLNGGNGEIGAGPEIELNQQLFGYDTKQQNDLTSQDQVFKLENIGSNDLENISVRIDNAMYAADADDTPAANYDSPFIVGYDVIYTLTEDTSNPGTYLKTPNVSGIDMGGEAYVNIRTKIGLSPGIYTARVYVSTVAAGDLDWFDVKFKVTEKPVYRVEVKNNHPDIGYGYLTDSGGAAAGSNTYEIDDTVYLHAVVVDTTGYVFDYWSSDTGEIGQNDFTDEDPSTADDHRRITTSFTMVEPSDGSTIIIVPNFDETTDVWVRLADLRSYNGDDPLNPNKLRDPTTLAYKDFAELTFDYAVIVPSDVNKNYVEFDVKDKLLDLTNPMTVTMDFNGNPLAVDSTTPDTGKSIVTYKSELFDLSDPGPDLVTIKTEYIDDSDPANPVTYTKTYTLKIYRKSAVQVDKQYGNSPMGLIYRAFTDTTQRSAAKAHFEANHTYVAYDSATGEYDNQYTPEYAATTYDTLYSTEAWGTGKNYDNDAYALFVYQGEKFVDPGYENLKYMDNATDVPDSEVTRTIEGVYTYPDTEDGILKKLDDATGPSSIEVAAKGGTDVLIEELADKKVRPGMYTLKYAFKDQDGTESSFSRPVIVLANKGDLNMDDGLPDATEADMIYQRLNDSTLYDKAINAADDWRLLYAYRVGDVTEDRNVNSIDANAILDIVKNNAVYKEYYEKLPSAPSGSWATKAADASPPPAATLPPDKATLTLDYLGTGRALGSRALSPNLTKETNEYNPDGNNITRFNSMVWVGIGIKNVLNLEYFSDGLYSVDLAIDYDPDIFEPCDNSAKALSDYSDDVTNFTEFYAQMIKERNLSVDTSITAADKALWRNGELYTASLKYDVDLDTDDRYKTVFVTIKSGDGTYLRLKDMPEDTEDTIYLLRLPFRLKKFPNLDPTAPDSYTGKALTISLTSQTFVLGAAENGVDASASWEGLVNKTTEVNNAKNHFDAVEIVDLFNTDGTFDIKGVIKGWNPSKPFVLEVFRTTNLTDEEPDYTFSSFDVNAANELMYGETTDTAAGEVTWNFKVPVSNLYDYTMRIKKLSHITYPEFSINRPDNAPETELADEIDLIVGDINEDGFVKNPDRVSLMRFFDRHKPWELYVNRFEASDLNGDNKVNLFDLNLLKQNLEKAYPEPTPTAEPTGGSG